MLLFSSDLPHWRNTNCYILVWHILLHLVHLTASSPLRVVHFEGYMFHSGQESDFHLGFPGNRLCHNRFTSELWVTVDPIMVESDGKPGIAT